VLEAGDGLVLRRHRAEDVPGIVAQCVDPLTVAFTTVPTPYGPEQAEQFLAACRRDWAAGDVAAFAVVVDGRFAGSVDLRLGEAGWGEVGFALGPWVRGSGVMTRALRCLLAWTFASPGDGVDGPSGAGLAGAGLEGVHWRAQVGNWASRRTAWRCGFRVEGEVRGLLVQRGARRDGWIGSLRCGDPQEPAEPWLGPVLR